MSPYSTVRCSNFACARPFVCHGRCVFFAEVESEMAAGAYRGMG